jgi:ribosomal protein S18 acetylase RimI-like enzyme
MKSSMEPVRPGRPADIETLVSMVREYCIEDGHVFEESRVRAALASLLADDRHGVVWVIGAPVQGYAVVTWGYSLESGGPDALLDEVYVRVRGRGLGARLLQAALDDSAARGMARMFLETETRNEGARRFYARHGFTIEDSIWMSRELD